MRRLTGSSSYPLDEGELSVGHSQSINSSLCTAVLLEILTADYEQLSALLNIIELDLTKLN